MSAEIRASVLGARLAKKALPPGGFRQSFKINPQRKHFATAHLAWG